MSSVNDSAFRDINLNFKFPRCGTFAHLRARSRTTAEAAPSNLRTGLEPVRDLTPISVVIPV